jgi:hypothetical protein
MKAFRQLVPAISVARAKELVNSLDCQGIAFEELLIEPSIIKEMFDGAALYTYEEDERYEMYMSDADAEERIFLKELQEANRWYDSLDVDSQYKINILLKASAPKG